MSDQRVAAITSHLDRFLKTFGLFLGCVVGLSGCPKLLCDLGVVDQCDTDTYTANGADSGTVPTDSTEYQAGNEVEVLGNSGNLVRAAYTFVGWTTAADRSDVSYTAANRFNIGLADVVLHAQ